MFVLVKLRKITFLSEKEQFDRTLFINACFATEIIKTKILVPSIQQSLERKVITEIESKILLRTTEEQMLKASHLTGIFKGKLPQEIRSLSLNRFLPENE